MNEQFVLKIDSAAAREDLAKLGRSLTTASGKIGKMNADFAAGVSLMDANVGRAIRTMSKYAEVVSLLGKIREVNNPATGIRDMAKAFDALGRARSFNPAQISGFKEFLKVVGEFKGSGGLMTMTKQLQQLAVAAREASTSLRTLPTSLRSIAGAGQGTARILRETGEGATRAHGGILRLSSGLGGLSGRFNLAYQAGTLFGTVFSVFTLGAFVKNVYDTNIQLLKLQKAVLFATGSFDGAKAATQEFINTSNELGLSVKDNIETYGRFVIAATASHVPLVETNRIYRDVGLALTVVGASSQQTQLAMYGLTEMLQKGVVYSKEFNRQIGAQLPGNAILGARALSLLEHHTVTVTDFFKKMHSGSLLSADFVPAWAEQIRKMYEPLLRLAQLRPDVAFNRLKNAFFSFGAAIGNGAFMTSIGHTVDDLTSKIIDSSGKLTPMAQRLADSIGQGLSKAVHLLGEAIDFLSKHFDTIIHVVKAFVVYDLTKTFIGWGVAASSALTPLISLTRTMSGLATAQAVVSRGGMGSAIFGMIAPAFPVTMARRGATAAAIAARPAQAAALYGGAMSAAPALYGAELGAAGGMADMRAASALYGGGIAASETAVAGGALEVTGTAGAAVVAGGSGLGIGAVMSALGGVTVVAAVAAAVLTLIRPADSGERSAGGRTISYGDIEDSAASKGIKFFIDLWNEFGTSISDMVESFGKFFNITNFGGKALALTLGILVDVVENFVNAVITPIRILGMGLNTIVDVFVSANKAISQVLHGDFSGAKTSLSDMTSRQAKGWASVYNKTFKSFDDTTFDILHDAGTSVDARGVTRDHDEAAQAQIEAAVRQQAAASTIEAAAQRFADATTGMDMVGTKFDPDKVVADLRAFAGGNFYAGSTPSDRATWGSMGDPNIKKILENSANVAGITPDRLQAMSSGTNFNPALQSWATHAPTMTTIRTQSGVTAEVNSAYAENFQGLLNDLESRGYKINTLSGYGRRPIAGTNIPSFHGQGGALDVNAANNPVGPANTNNLPADVSALAAAHGLGWGGNWRSSKDPMHFSIAASEGGTVPMSHYGPPRYWGNPNYIGPYQVNRDISGELGSNVNLQSAATATPAVAAYLAKFDKLIGHTANPGEGVIPLMFGLKAGQTFLDATAGGHEDTLHSKDVFSADQFALFSKSHPEIFFHKNNGKFDKTSDMTVRETYAAMLGRVGYAPTGQDGVATPDPFGGGTGNENTASAVAERNFKTVQGIIARANPAAAAQSEQQDQLLAITKVQKSMQEILAKDVGPWAKNFLRDKEILDGITASVDRMKQQVADAENPIGKMNRLQDAANQISALRVSGMSDEADYQAKINELVEQGYRRQDIDNDVTHQAYLNGLQYAEVLKLQLDYKKKLADINLEEAVRAAKTPFEAELAREREAARHPGESDSVLDRRLNMPSNFVERNAPTARDVIAASSQTTAAHTASTVVTNINTAIEQARYLESLTGRARDFAVAETEFLGNYTGLTGKTLAELEAAVDPKLLTGIKDLVAAKLALDKPIGIRAWVDSIEPFADKLQDIQHEFLDGMSKGFADFVVDGKTDLSGMFKGIEKELVQSAFENYAVKPLLSSLGLGGLDPTKPSGSVFDPMFVTVTNLTGLEGQTGGGAGGIGGLLGSLFGGNGSKPFTVDGGSFGGVLSDLLGGASQAGKVASGAGGAASGIMSGIGDWFSSLFGFASGGSFKVGGNGPTDSKLVAFKATPGENVVVGHDSQMMGGGDVHVAVYDQRGAKDSSPVQVKHGRNANGQRQIEVLVRDAMKKSVANGDLDTVMGSTYGSQRVGGSR